jgi:4-hydroxythreonine-4-phosphate dehydrogenase
VRNLARLAAGAATGHATTGTAAAADLILTGGETAREVLDALGVRSLTPVVSVQHGAVVSLSDDGRLVGTKPGSFGDSDALVQLYSAIKDLRSSNSISHPSLEPGAPMTSAVNATEQDTRPFIAVTMGDGAGVGPEVTVGALLDENAYRDCRPVVIGDVRRLQLGAEALGVEANIVEVETVGEAVFEAGRINVIDPKLLSADLPWGQESAEAGNAAYHYIRIACELGMAGQVQGICTAPLNKAALHKAGHIYPGHTELLAHFMGIEEVSMMLSTPKVKVIHVTTHIGLIDAINKIEPGLVERTVRRGHSAMQRAGIANPKIGVCAINPHAGENGLFGYGEEAEKITPAIEKLQADGIDARGPLPADTAFFLAGRGDYDLIVAMYHDQGHGPIKVLGIEAGVNITVGLPVIRTSVDHGTAFDIAGKGIVDVRSMIEALRQAAEMSPSPAAA